MSATRRKRWVWTDEAIEQVVSARRQGRTHASIAREVGCRKQNIDQLFYRLRREKANQEPLTVKLTNEQKSSSGPSCGRRTGCWRAGRED